MEHPYIQRSRKFYHIVKCFRVQSIGEISYVTVEGFESRKIAFGDFSNSANGKNDLHSYSPIPFTFSYLLISQGVSTQAIDRKAESGLWSRQIYHNLIGYRNTIHHHHFALY